VPSQRCCNASAAGPTPGAAAPRVGLVTTGTPTPTRQTLTRAGCLALLAPGGHGRVAATMRAVPVIIPVAFNVFGEDVVFGPGPGDDLSRAIENSVVAFEADHLGDDGRGDWGVHVTGVARTLTGGEDGHRFRLSSEIITGWHAIGAGSVSG
jgi:nitroimidazol reductase NimA-like FMN-containing flavoprotein (pyridoxamine 5'-phosphate oxidase superfamily)